MQDGWTPLHLAIQSRNRDIAKVLLVNGADKTRRTKVLFHIFLLISNIHQKKYFTVIAALRFVLFHKTSCVAYEDIRFMLSIRQLFDIPATTCPSSYLDE
jgi:ankyrin repeat protein